MGLNFRKSFKIAPGVRLNIGKKGISSISMGTKGARVSVGKKGTRSTVGIPGSGLSYSSYSPHQSKSKVQSVQQAEYDEINSPPPLNYYAELPVRQVGLLLGLGIFILPFIFAWLTLRQGYSTPARVISMIWMVFIIISFT